MDLKMALNKSAHAAVLPSVLCIDSHEGDRHTVETMLGETCKVVRASTVTAGLRMLSKGRFAAVLCDTEQTEGSWRQVLLATTHKADAPLLIVTSRLADETLWAEALNLGAWDVLAKPFDLQEVTRIISSTCHHWRMRSSSARRAMRAGSETTAIDADTLGANVACA